VVSRTEERLNPRGPPLYEVSREKGVRQSTAREEGEAAGCGKKKTLSVGNTRKDQRMHPG